MFSLHEEIAFKLNPVFEARFNVKLRQNRSEKFKRKAKKIAATKRTLKLRKRTISVVTYVTKGLLLTNTYKVTFTKSIADTFLNATNVQKASRLKSI